MQHFKVLAALCLFALVATLPASAQKRVSETIDLDADGRVMIDTYKGSIQVSTWDRDEVEIDAVIEADGMEHLVELTEVEINRSGRSLRIETDYTRAKKEGKRRRGIFGNNSLSLPFVHYTIRMPETANLRIEDYKSEITVKSLAADLDIETYKGEVDLTDIAGELTIDTYKGDVDVRDLAGSLEADTYKGNISVEFAEFAGHTSIDTYRGEIELRFPEEAGFDLYADMGKSGDFDTNFKLNNIRVNDNKYSGEIAGGGPRLELETYRGNFYIARAR